MTELESKNQSKELELDDLLISNTEDNDELQEGNSKKIILLSAIGILLFAIVILVVYLLQGDSEDSEQFESPSATLERVEQPKRSSASNFDYGQEPIQNGTDDQFQRIIDQIKAQQMQQENLPSVPQTQIPQNTQPVKSEPIKNVEQQKPTVQQIEPKQKPSDVFKNVTTNDPNLQGSEATTGFYVQVGSFSKFAPNKQLLSAIESEKFSYRMQKAGDNNRLLIGPYATKEEAQNQLNDIRAKLNKDAFIKEIK